ncbi:MAG: MoaD/ThiS family protein [Phycisphaerae bacterium]|nr:MoaD/ThiS family protein [Phycisphaerae bacterium]NUQ45522.1 MoaD/ThiS family protein [Phycisphaerae bacterium]
MTIHLRFLGPAADWAGATRAELTVDEGTTLGTLAGRIAEQWPAVGQRVGVRPAVNHAYVALDTVLRDGDEVALIPPVSGG